MSNFEDIGLMKRITKGDERAFEVLREKHGAKVLGVVKPLLRNLDADIDEVCQDTWVRVWEKAHTFEGRSQFSSWLYRITYNAALMKVRVNKSASGPLMPLEMLIKSTGQEPGVDPRTEEVFAAKEKVVRIHKFLKRKTVRKWCYPVARLMGSGFSCKEAGRILKLSGPAYKSRVHRTRLEIKRCMKAA